jgi:hypothetical protein
MKSLAYALMLVVLFAAMTMAVMFLGQQTTRKPVTVNYQTAKSGQIEVQWGAGSEADLNRAGARP